MAPDKSLAAEIEASDERASRGPAALADELQRLVDRYGAGDGSVDRLVTLHFDTILDALRAAEIAALQSRAFEDGERKRLADALAVYDAAERDLTDAEAVYQDTCQRMGDEPDMGEIMDRVGAEQACMRCSMAKGIARADLVRAARAVLKLEGGRNV